MGLSMSRLRWILAGAVALVAGVATVTAFRTYVAHQLTVGMLAVGALAVTLAAGMASLASARLRIERELAAMRSTPPGGSLLAARRHRLAAIKAAGVRPDREALAQAAAAEEAGRAYIGRYLVATTVLIGLVGTFAGLMETLGKVAPLLGERETEGLALLAGPLSGLHVTFGASLVAILATLALALAQGDLALHEGQALATLEDLTTHDLIPRMWPRSEEPAERTVRALDDLRGMLGDAVVAALEKSARRMAESTRADGERATRALESTAATIKEEVTRLCAAVGAAFEETSRRQGAALAEASETAVQKATAAAEEGVRRTADVASEAVRAAAAQLATTLQPLFTAEDGRLEAVREGLGRASASIDQAAGRIGEASTVMESVSRAHAEAVEHAAQGVLAAFDRAVVSGGAALGGAASSLAASARDLRAGTDAFGPKLTALSTELGALGRELAVLAARDPEGDLAAVVLGELDRLGAGMDRLTELARLAAPAPRNGDGDHGDGDHGSDDGNQGHNDDGKEKEQSAGGAESAEHAGQSPALATEEAPS
jgi:hypothetical protein